MTRTHSVGLLWTRDRPVADTRRLALRKAFAQCGLFYALLPIQNLWCLQSGLEVSKSRGGPTAAHMFQRDLSPLSAVTCGTSV